MMSICFDINEILIYLLVGHLCLSPSRPYFSGVNIIKKWDKVVTYFNFFETVFPSEPNCLATECICLAVLDFGIPFSWSSFPPESTKSGGIGSALETGSRKQAGRGTYIVKQIYSSIISLAFACNHKECLKLIFGLLHLGIGVQYIYILVLRRLFPVYQKLLKYFEIHLIMCLLTITWTISRYSLRRHNLSWSCNTNLIID